MEIIRQRGFEPVSENGLVLAQKMFNLFKSKGFEKIYINGEYVEPKRATSRSAGSDIYYTGIEPIVINPGEKVAIITNIKAYMQDGEVLLAFVRSSQGMFKDLILCNTVGVIDADYYNSESNEGNIGVSLKNMGDKPVIIEKGEAVGQLVFVPFLKPDNEPIDAVRKGGYGSTVK